MTDCTCEATDKCPICAEPFKADDLCATDIELGTCHAGCLEGSPIVDLDTGEPSDGPLTLFQYDDPRTMTTEACGGCGEADPAKQCLGCLHDFGPAPPSAVSPETQQGVG